MFIFTAKFRPERVALGVLAVALVCTAALGARALFGGHTAAVSDNLPSPKGVKTAEDRVAYLEGYGWVVDPEPIAVEELLIPEEFDASYDRYLELQSSQGFDLTRYTGKRVKRYAYEIRNYPTGEQGVQAGLLIYKNTVIGGEVLSAKADGFLHGLAMPES